MRKHAEDVKDINFISITQYVVCVSPDIARKTIDLMIYLDTNMKKEDDTSRIGLWLATLTRAYLCILKDKD
jgi:hypothetical protein